MCAKELSDDVQQVREHVYWATLDSLTVNCQELLEMLAEELEAGNFEAANPEDEVYREHLISSLRHAIRELQRWTVPRDVMESL